MSTSKGLKELQLGINFGLAMSVKIKQILYSADSHQVAKHGHVLPGGGGRERDDQEGGEGPL